MKRMLQRVDILANVRTDKLNFYLVMNSSAFQFLFFFVCVTSACLEARRAAHGGCRADVLPARDQPADPGNAEEVQHGEANHLQHVSVLPEGQIADLTYWADRNNRVQPDKFLL